MSAPLRKPRVGHILRVIVFAVAFAATSTGAQVCDPTSLWQNTNRVTRATSDARFGLGLTFVVTGSTLRAVWNESGPAPMPHIAGESRWVWSTGGATIQNYPNPVVLSSDAKEYLFVGAANGTVYKIDASSGVTVSSVDTRRPVCLADRIIATPSVQLYAYSNPVFRSDMDLIRGHPDDLVIVVTKTGCADHASNRVIGLFASDLTIKWIFNNSFAQPMDGAEAECTVDYDTNRIYCGTEQTLPTQPSLWALNSMSGALVWSQPAGTIKNRPALDLGNLFVVSSGNHLQKRSATTGAMIWDYPFALSIVRSPGVARGGTWQNKILVLDSGGAVHAIEDGGTIAVPVWGPIYPGSGLMYVSVPAVAPEHNKAYLGRNDGKVQQIELSTGAGGVTTTTVIGSPVWDTTLDYSSPSAASLDRLIVPYADGTIARYCIPWPSTGVSTPLVETARFQLTTRPNPTPGTMRMEFELPFSASVEIDMYAVTGKRVRRLLRSDRPAGRHEVPWDGLDDDGRLASSGIYFLQLRAVGVAGQVHEESRKIEVLR